MPRKTVLEPYHAIVSGDMSQATLTSPVTSIQFVDNCLIQLNFTGTPTGSFAVQVSSDYQNNLGVITNPGNWIPLTLSSTPSAAGAAGQIIIDMNEMPAPYIRVVYTRVSGSGTLDMYITAKSLGG